MKGGSGKDRTESLDSVSSDRISEFVNDKRIPDPSHPPISKLDGMVNSPFHQSKENFRRDSEDEEAGYGDDDGEEDGDGIRLSNLTGGRPSENDGSDKSFKSNTKSTQNKKKSGWL